MLNTREITRMVVRNPVLWGAAATVGLYATVHTGVLTEPLALRYLAGHWAAYGCVALFFVGLAGLVLKGVEIAEQLRPMTLELLDPIPAKQQPVTDCPALIARLEKQPAGVLGSSLVRRLLAALDHLARKGSIATLDDELRTLADQDLVRKSASYGAVRMAIWAIPFVGALGTVVGIGGAVAGLAGDPSGNVVVGVTPGLELVFDTTALALGLSVLLMSGLFLCDQLETRLLLAIDDRVRHELVGRFRAEAVAPNGRPSAGPTEVPDSLLGAMEKMVERQTELFKASLEAAQKQFDERTEVMRQQIEKSLAGGVSTAAARGPAMSFDGDFQDVMRRSASLAATQQAELSAQNEIFQELAALIEGQGSLNWPVRRSPRFKNNTATAATGGSDDWFDGA